MRNYCVTFLVVLTCTICPSYAQFIYDIIDNNSVTITGYDGSGGDVIVPEVIEELPVRMIGSQAFFNHSGLTSIVIPDTVISIEENSFYGCTNLASASIGNNVTTIGLQAFRECESLINVTLPDSVTNIGSCAFCGCSSLLNITIGIGVSGIGEGVFSGCRSLINIDVNPLNPTYSSLDGMLFNKDQTTIIRCPEGKVSSATIPATVTLIEEYAFGRCENLTSVTIGQNVTGIGRSAFKRCLNLTNIFLPDSVTSIGWYAFSDCQSLVSMTIPIGVATIGRQAFSGCENLSAFHVEPNNPFFCSLEGVLYDKDKTMLIIYPEGKMGNYSISSGVGYIESYAFNGCNNITSITIPASLTDLGGEVFSYCSLKEVYFRGDPPSFAFGEWGRDTFKNPFVGSDVTIYFLPGNTGWGDTFGDRPTSFWLPKVLTADPNFGFLAGHFGFTVSWASDQTLVVEASDNLVSPIWTTISTNNLVEDAFYFSDPDWKINSVKFYRLRGL